MNFFPRQKHDVGRRMGTCETQRSISAWWYHPILSFSFSLSLARSVFLPRSREADGHCTKRSRIVKTTTQDVCHLARMLGALVCSCWAYNPYASTWIVTQDCSAHSGLDPTGATVLVCREEQYTALWERPQLDGLWIPAWCALWSGGSNHKTLQSAADYEPVPELGCA